MPTSLMVALGINCFRIFEFEPSAPTKRSQSSVLPSLKYALVPPFGSTSYRSKAMPVRRKEACWTRPSLRCHLDTENWSLVGFESQVNIFSPLPLKNSIFSPPSGCSPIPRARCAQMSLCSLRFSIPSVVPDSITRNPTTRSSTASLRS